MSAVKGHKVTYTPYADGRLTATCGCGWTYTNSVRTDVRQQVAWPRQAAA